MTFEEKQLAYCGIYCPQCSFRTAYETQDLSHVLAMPPRYDKLKSMSMEECRCECCKGENICGPCAMRDCAGSKGLVSCADCEAFPCGEILRFETDDSPHHHAAVANLRAIARDGYSAWFEAFKASLACKSCGERLSWYRGCASGCEGALHGQGPADMSSGA